MDDSPKVMGRPVNSFNIEIDAGRVYSLAAQGCTVVEISKIVGCSTDTLHRRFQKEMDMARNLTLSKIRSVLLDEGLNKRNAMILKHIADRYLGCIDNPMVDFKISEQPNKLIIEFIDPHEPKKEETIDVNFHQIEPEDNEV